MNTTTLARNHAGQSGGHAFSASLNKAMTHLLGGLSALDKRLRERPASVAEQTEALLRLADAYESTQPSYAADLRAAASAARQALPLSR